MQKPSHHPKLTRNTRFIYEGWNVTNVTNPTKSSVAKFTYDGFGRTVSQSGSKSGIDINALNYRFSTKPMELELATSNTTLVPPPVSSGLYYYGYRFYSPNMGRWISRDPIREQGGRNLYGMIGNDVQNRLDLLGLAWKRIGVINGGKRILWEKENESDSSEDLAKKVKLGPQEFSAWAKQDPQKKCRYSTPNVYIVADILRGHSAENPFLILYQRTVNVGGTVGTIGTITLGRNRVEASSIAQLQNALTENHRDIIGIAIYGHGNQEGTLSQSDRQNEIPSGELLELVSGNGFKLSSAYIMQCYGGYQHDIYIGWRDRVYHHLMIYFGLNVFGFDFGVNPDWDPNVNPLNR